MAEIQLTDDAFDKEVVEEREAMAHMVREISQQASRHGPAGSPRIPQCACLCSVW